MTEDVVRRCSRALFRRVAQTLPTLVFAAGALFGQTVTAEPPTCLQQIADLTRELHRLQIEIAIHRLESHGRRAEALEGQIARAVSERRLAEHGESTLREELLSVDVQLARTDLQHEERSELQTLRTGLLTEDQDRLRERNRAGNERESALQRQLERERSSIQELRERLAKLRSKDIAIAERSGRR